jgi:hypothetical protein
MTVMVNDVWYQTTIDIKVEIVFFTTVGEAITSAVTSIDQSEIT